MIISRTNIQKIGTKISSYIGFAIRSNHVVYGVDNITAYKKKLPLLLVSAGISDGSRDKIDRLADSRECPIYYLEAGLLEDYVHRTGVKAIAILDTSLAVAIINCISSL